MSELVTKFYGTDTKKRLQAEVNSFLAKIGDRLVSIQYASISGYESESHLYPPEYGVMILYKRLEKGRPSEDAIKEQDEEC